MFNYHNLLKPTYLRELCNSYHLIPSKKYGQNYLISESPIQKMLEAGNLKKTDIAVEIGPGFGILTFAVASRVKKVFAFEIEKKLEDYWNDNAPENVEVIWGNVLQKFDYFIETQLTPLTPSLTKERGRTFVSPLSSVREGQGVSCVARCVGELHRCAYKVLANLPYQITSNALRVLLEAEHKPEQIIVMVQKEVAERITAKKGDMSLLAVSVQYYGIPKTIAKVSAGNFWPAPKVDSAILSIEKIGEHTYGIEDTYFFKIVSTGFANKRKQLWRNLSVGLKLDGAQVKQILHEVTGNEQIRAQELGVEEWVDVVKNLSTVES